MMMKKIMLYTLGFALFSQVQLTQADDVIITDVCLKKEGIVCTYPINKTCEEGTEGCVCIDETCDEGTEGCVCKDSSGNTCHQGTEGCVCTYPGGKSCHQGTEGCVCTYPGGKSCHKGAPGCICVDNTLKCSDLNYTLTQTEKNNFITNHSNAICNACPLDYENWACAAKEEEQPIEILIYKPAVVSGGSPACTKFPSCYDLGYAFSSAEVEKISKDFSCSACPYDGSKWACAKGNNLYKPASNTNNNAHN